MRVIIAFLTRKVKAETYAFARQVNVMTGWPVRIISDEEPEEGFVSLDGAGKSVAVFKVSRHECEKAGFCKTQEGSTNIKSDVVALDKFLYYFSKKDFDFVWVFEDDVFIPSTDTIVALHKKYSGFGKIDLVTGRHKKRLDHENFFWQWPIIDKIIDKPHYYSMVCAMGFSKKMMNVIAKYAATNLRLFYCEVLFNTLAEQNKLTVCAAEELRSVVWMGDWDEDDFMQLPNNVFHPVKDIENHIKKRDLIQKLIAKGYQPKKPLPDFLQHD